MQSVDRDHYANPNKVFFYGRHILQSIDSITQECRQARYFYLKGALQRNVNIEIESDKSKVESFLSKLGFSATLSQSLNEAEKDYSDSSNVFELKNCPRAPS
jgi:hypothetical protein